MKKSNTEISNTLKVKVENLHAIWAYGRNNIGYYLPDYQDKFIYIILGDGNIYDQHFDIMLEKKHDGYFDFIRNIRFILPDKADYLLL